MNVIVFSLVTISDLTEIQILINPALGRLKITHVSDPAQCVEIDFLPYSVFRT